MRGTPKMSVRIDPTERAQLAREASDLGTDLSTAMRQGARLWLEALRISISAKPVSKGGRPRMS